MELWVLFHPPKSSGAVPLARIADDIRAVDAWCDGQGIDWVSNLEAANYHATFVDQRGRDWFNKVDGRHFHDAADEILSVWGACKRLGGLLYDEAELMQTWRNGTVKGMRKPWIYDPAGRRLEDAADEFAAAGAAHAQRYARRGIRLYAEHLLPLAGEDYQVWELDLPGQNTIGFKCAEIGAKPKAAWWDLNVPTAAYRRGAPSTDGPAPHQLVADGSNSPVTLRPERPVPASTPPDEHVLDRGGEVRPFAGSSAPM